MRRATLAVLVLLAAPATAQAPWPEEFTNPRAADGDLLLLMPCGGAMAFRPVATPAGPGALDDRQVTLGTTDRPAASPNSPAASPSPGPSPRKGMTVRSTGSASTR
jgi:hypothetical protein